MCLEFRSLCQVYKCTVSLIVRVGINYTVLYTNTPGTRVGPGSMTKLVLKVEEKNGYSIRGCSIAVLSIFPSYIQRRPYVYQKVQ